MRTVKNIGLFIPNVLIFAGGFIGELFSDTAKEPRAAIGLYFLGILLTAIVSVLFWPILAKLPTYILILIAIHGPILLIALMALGFAVLFAGLSPWKFGTWWIDEDGKLIRVK